MNPRCQVGVLAMGLWLSAGQAAHAQQAVGATFGDVIQLQGGTPSDIVLDELRHQLYLVSNTTSQVLVLDYTTNQVVARIATGRTPLAGAMSMDGNFLYVTASGPPSALYAIDLTTQPPGVQPDAAFDAAGSRNGNRRARAGGHGRDRRDGRRSAEDAAGVRPGDPGP